MGMFAAGSEISGVTGGPKALLTALAAAIRDCLVNQSGVSADHLITVGTGFSERVDPRRPYAPRNRRVVVVNAGSS